MKQSKLEEEIEDSEEEVCYRGKQKGYIGEKLRFLCLSYMSLKIIFNIFQASIKIIFNKFLFQKRK